MATGDRFVWGAVAVAAGMMCWALAGDGELSEGERADLLREWQAEAAELRLEQVELEIQFEDEGLDVWQIRDRLAQYRQREAVRLAAQRQRGVTIDRFTPRASAQRPAPSSPEEAELREILDRAGEKWNELTGGATTIGQMREAQREMGRWQELHPEDARRADELRRALGEREWNELKPITVESPAGGGADGDLIHSLGVEMAEKMMALRAAHPDADAREFYREVVGAERAFFDERELQIRAAAKRVRSSELRVERDALLEAAAAPN